MACLDLPMMAAKSSCAHRALLHHLAKYLAGVLGLNLEKGLLIHRQK